MIVRPNTPEIMEGTEGTCIFQRRLHFHERLCYVRSDRPGSPLTRRVRSRNHGDGQCECGHYNLVSQHLDLPGRLTSLVVYSLHVRPMGLN